MRDSLETRDAKRATQKAWADLSTSEREVKNLRRELDDERERHAETRAALYEARRDLRDAQAAFAKVEQRLPWVPRGARRR